MPRFLSVIPTLLLVVGIAAPSALTLLTASPAAALTIRGVDVTPTPAGASFSLTFNAPLKLNAEEDGTAFGWDEFQFLIYPHEAGIPRTVVRGGEIPCAGAIPVRAFDPPDTTACSAGWGAERDAVPYYLTGATVRFFVPWASLGSGGPFPFRFLLEVTRSGATTDERWGECPGLLLAPAGAAAAVPASWGEIKRLYR